MFFWSRTEKAWGITLRHEIGQFVKVGHHELVDKNQAELPVETKHSKSRHKRKKKLEYRLKGFYSPSEKLFKNLDFDLH